MEESYILTEKGKIMALQILHHGDLLPELSGNLATDASLVRAACAKYIEASVAKGEARSEEECADVIAIALFDAYLEALSQKIN